MAGNKSLLRAKKEKNDEFWTRYIDVETEIEHYVRFDPEQFRGKTILCPCDDPDRSAFPRWFRDNAERLGIVRVLSSCFVKGGHGRWEDWTPEKTVRGEWEGDGDFRSEEVSALKKRADIVVTNPPFSLFREFMAWLEPEQG